jgi:hypothetical protein
MRTLLSAIALVAAISWTPAPADAGILGLFGFDCSGRHNCGCKQGGGGCGGCCEPACGCGRGCYANCGEPACGCDSCCEPACGCGGGCCCNGRQYAGQTFDCCCESHAPICPCVGSNDCCQSGGCGECCEPACGCNSCGEPCCGCNSGCGPSCGAGTACCPHKCCLKHVGFCTPCGHLVNTFCKCTSCNGCNGEIYWSEWHNDPPYCQDPCDCHANWIGPSGGCNGCSSGACGCEGGYAAQGAPVHGGAAYAQPGTPMSTARPQVATGIRPQQPANGYRPAYAGRQLNPSYQMAQSQQAQQSQSQPVRTASRPMTTNRMPAGSSNSAQSRPILW